MPAQRTWLVMLRDVSSAVRVRGMGGATAALVLDPESLNVLAAEVAPTADEALLMAVDAAGTSPAIGIAARPALVHYLGAPVQAVTRALQELSEKLGWELPVVAVAEPSRVAEDVFDSFVGHMSGRQQPQEFASPDLWEQLYGLAWRFFLSSLWERWADEVDLSIRLSVDGHESELAGVVLGNAGIQFGLVLYPGPEPPPQLRKWKRATDVPVPDGTLMFHLDAASRLPADLVGKAVRYGWPESQERMPLLVRLIARKPCDLGAAPAVDLSASMLRDDAGRTRGEHHQPSAALRLRLGKTNPRPVCLCRARRTYSCSKLAEKSSHFSPSASPRRRPVVASSTQSAWSRQTD